jgi:uncharacterized tellurite resistance protein B-like protein
MLDALKKLLAGATQVSQHDEQERLRHSVAALLHEMTRVDMHVKPEDIGHAREALIDLLGVDAAQAEALLAHAAQPANRLTSYFDAVSAVNRSFSQAQKIRLVEHLWRVAHADDSLDLHEDHLVRKISDLLHVPHIESMLARQRVRASRDPG